MSRGILCVVSGFSGAGKGSVVDALVNRYDNYALSVSVTTRQPRKGEQEGKSYFFRTTEEFEQLIQAGEFLEHAKYVNNYYGTPRSYVEEQLEAGKNVILEIDLQGALQIRAQLPESILVFVTPPSMEVLKERLTGRGTETPDVIRERLKRAEEESREMDHYDYLLVNDDLSVAADTLNEIIQGESNRMSRNLEFVNRIKEEAKQFAND